MQAAQAGVIRRMGMECGHQYELAGLTTLSKVIVAAALATMRGALVEANGNHHIKLIHIFISSPDSARIAFTEGAHGFQGLSNIVIPDIIT